MSLLNNLLINFKNFPFFNSILFVILLFIGWPSLSLATPKSPPLTQEAYSQIKDFSNEILKLKKSMPEYQIIFIGRSNIFLAAYLRSIGFENFKFLPLSNIKYFPSPSVESLAKDNFKYLSWEFILEGISTKKFILIDYVNNGASFSRLLHWLKEFDTEYSIIALTYGSSLSKEKIPYGIVNKKLSSNQLFGNINVGSLLNLSYESVPENYAPFSSWDPLIQTSSPEIDEKKSFYQNYISFNELIEYFTKLNQGSYQYLPKLKLQNCSYIDSRYL